MTQTPTSKINAERTRPRNTTVTEEPKKKKPRKGFSFSTLAWQLGLLLFILVLWHVAAVSKWIDPVLARTPGQVWNFLVQSSGSGELWRNTWATVSAALAAFVLAGAVGVIAGVALGLMPRVERVLSPYIDMANAMPRIALAPVFIVYFGIGPSAKIALAFTFVLFMVMSGARAGVRSADGELLRLSTVLGASKFQLFMKVLMPVAVPSIFASLRLGLIYSLLGVVGSEIIASRDGLGQMVARYSGSFDMEAVYGVVLLLALLATILNQVMAWLENNLLKWQPPAD